MIFVPGSINRTPTGVGITYHKTGLKKSIHMNTDPCGILVVDKEKNMTSHDVVYLIRRLYSIRKVGHAGTLDPNATGVLVMLLGKATKLSNKFLTEDKEYLATMKLGERTDSADIEGAIIDMREVDVTEETIKKVISEFHGEIEQVPPMVSAKKIGGKRLYQLARKGVSVERPPVKVFIKEIEVEEIDIPLVRFRVACGKGTYIRQLADDIGERLGCGAHLVELRRTRSGEFSIEDAITLEDLRKMNKDELDESITRV